MYNLTENQMEAIKLLSIFKYLTSSQFVKLGVFKKRAYLTNSLKILLDRKNPLISKHDFNPVNGKLESFYYLTKYGKKYLVNELEYVESKIKVPLGVNQIYIKDYFHRKYTIDFHLAFRQWIESRKGKVEFLNYYFDKAGNNRSKNKNDYVTALNKIQVDKVRSFIPDINAIFVHNDTKYLFLFEQHNGKDVKRLSDQLHVHLLAIFQDIVSKKFKFNKSNRVAVVCEEKNVKDSIIKRLQNTDDFKNFYNHFIFKTIDELKEDFFNNWTLINGEQVSFIQKSNSNLSNNEVI
jgi:hypothetical protein